MTSFYLENFDDGDLTERPQSAEYKRGFADAQAAAQSSDAAQLARSLSEVSSTLKDMAFGYEEARQVMTSRVAPVLNQIAELVVPEVLEATFGHHLVQALSGSIQAVASAPIPIGVNPETLAQLAANEVDVPPQFELVEDTSLTTGQAVVVTPDSPFLLDLASLSSALKTALNAVEPFERSLKNG